jgi:NAD+ kinase
MKVAIYGQYYQNSTEPIIKIFLFFLKQRRIIIANFLEMLYEKQIVQKNTIHSPRIMNSWRNFFDVNKHCGDGTILRAATMVSFKYSYFLGINVGRLGFLYSSKKKISILLQLVLTNNIILIKKGHYWA